MNESTIRVNQRVANTEGREGVVLSIDQYPFTKDVAKVRYYDGETKYVYIDALRPAPLNAPKPGRLEEEPIKVEDRVRHKLDVAPEFRRLGGTVIGLRSGYPRLVRVEWDGMKEPRLELETQLEIVHRAKVPTESNPAQEVIDLLDAKREVVKEQIAELQAFLGSLTAAKKTLVRAND